MNYPLLAMHTVVGIKLHNIKYKFLKKMVKSSTGSFVFKFFASKQTPPYPDPQN